MSHSERFSNFGKEKSQNRKCVTIWITICIDNGKPVTTSEQLKPEDKDRKSLDNIYKKNLVCQHTYRFSEPANHPML